MKTRRKQLLLCSYGLKIDHITLETIREARKCEVLFCDGVGFEARLKGIFPNIKELETKPGTVPVEQKVKRILRAFSSHNSVAAMTYGHPTFLCSLSDLLEKECEKRGITVRVTGAISSSSETLALAGITTLSEAAVLMTSAIGMPNMEHIQPRLHVFIYDFHTLDENRFAEIKNRLQEHLAGHYPAGHRVELLECESNSQGQIQSVAIEELDKALHLSSPNTTLHIPPLKTFPRKRGRKLSKGKQLSAES